MVRAEPDRAALEVAHRMLGTPTPLDDLLTHPTFQLVLKMLARRHMRRRGQVDVKKLQANDHD